MCNSSFEKEKEVSGAERNLEIRAGSFGVYRPNPEVRNAPPAPPRPQPPLAPSPTSCRPGWLLPPRARGARAHVLVHRHDTHMPTYPCGTALLPGGSAPRRGTVPQDEPVPGLAQRWHRGNAAGPAWCQAQASPTLMPSPARSCVPSWGPLGGQEAVVGDEGAVPPQGTARVPGCPQLQPQNLGRPCLPCPPAAGSCSCSSHWQVTGGNYCFI